MSTNLLYSKFVPIRQSLKLAYAMQSMEKVGRRRAIICAQNQGWDMAAPCYKLSQACLHFYPGPYHRTRSPVPYPGDSQDRCLNQLTSSEDCEREALGQQQISAAGEEHGSRCLGQCELKGCPRPRKKTHPFHKFKVVSFGRGADEW